MSPRNKINKNKNSARPQKNYQILLSHLKSNLITWIYNSKFQIWFNNSGFYRVPKAIITILKAFRNIIINRTTNN